MALPTRRPEIIQPAPASPVVPEPMAQVIRPAQFRPSLPTVRPTVIVPPPAPPVAPAPPETPEPAEEEMTKVWVVVPKALKVAVKALATEKDTTLSEVTRRGLEMAVATRRIGPPPHGPRWLALKRDEQWTAYYEGRGPHPSTVDIYGRPWKD